MDTQYNHYLSKIKRVLNKNLFNSSLEDFDAIFDVAYSVHDNSFLPSGEPSISHPVAVIEILADLGFDDDVF